MGRLSKNKSLSRLIKYQKRDGGCFLRDAKEKLDLFGLTVMLTLMIAMLSNAAVADKAVWARQDQDGINVYFSNGTTPLALSHAGTNVAPMLHSEKGLSKVVWARNESQHNSIYMANIDQLGQVLSVTQVPDSVGWVFGPAVFFTGSGAEAQTWVAWTQFDGKQDDVFLTKYFDGQWHAPRRLTAVDGYSDTLPNFSLHENGDLLLTWYRSSRSEQQQLSLVIETAQALSSPTLRKERGNSDLSDIAIALTTELKIVPLEDADLLTAPRKVPSDLQESYKQIVGELEVFGGAIETDNGQTARLWPQ